VNARAQGAAITSITHFYVHPFDFTGYVRPIQFWNNTLGHAAGHFFALVASFTLFILLWRRRSASNLPLVMLFPLAAIFAGIGGFEDMLSRARTKYKDETLISM
jgi:hypothetical protein